MPLLDIFNNDAFKPVTLSAAIDKIETVPDHLGSLGVFHDEPVRTETIAIEDRDGTLSLIQTSARGEPLDSESVDKRKIRDFRTRRIAKKVRIMASELQFVRQFGEEQAVIEVQAEIARRLSGPNGLVADVETTWENFRLGCVQGILVDADSSTIENYFTAFGISQPSELAFDLANKVDGNLRAFIQSKIVRPMRRSAKGVTIRGVYALCGDTFWDDFIKNAEVRETYLRQVEARDLRTGYDLEELSYGGVTWANYVGSDDNSKVAIADTKVKFFPSGNTGIFDTAFAPGESFADIGQLGQPLYAKVIPDRDRDSYVDLEVYSYPLHIAKRPDLLLRGKAGA